MKELEKNLTMLGQDFNLQRGSPWLVQTAWPALKTDSTFFSASPKAVWRQSRTLVEG